MNQWASEARSVGLPWPLQPRSGKSVNTEIRRIRMIFAGKNLSVGVLNDKIYMAGFGTVKCNSMEPAIEYGPRFQRQPADCVIGNSGKIGSRFLQD